MAEGRFTALSVFSNYLPIWLSIGIAVGYFGSPIVSPYAFLAPLTLSVMMLAVGFTTPLKDFRANLGSVIPGTLVQWVMPLLGFVRGGSVESSFDVNFLQDILLYHHEYLLSHFNTSH